MKKEKDVTELQEYMFWPGTEWLSEYIEENKLREFHLTNDDVKTRDNVYGIPTALLRWKMLRKNPVKHNRDITRPVPVTIASHYMDVQMFMDIFLSAEIYFYTQNWTKLGTDPYRREKQEK